MIPSRRPCTILASGLAATLGWAAVAEAQPVATGEVASATGEVASLDRTVPFAETVEVDWVSVPVVVRSPRGYRGELAAGKFHLFVDGREIAPEGFEPAAEAPYEVALLQDVSGSMDGTGGIAAGRQLLDCFLARAHPGDRFSIASFGDRRHGVDLDFTSDRDLIVRTAQAWRPFGTTALHEAVADLGEMFDPTAIGAAHRAIVLVTDGTDNASGISAAMARESAYRAKLPVYVVEMGGGADDRQAPTGPEPLALLATSTGGRYFPIVEPESAARVCHAISLELRNQYTLGFSTRSAATKSFHEISVEVAGTDRRQVLHRAGYYGRPPADAVH